MAESDSVGSRAPHRQLAPVVAGAAVAAVPVGLALSVFGFFGWCVGPLVLGAGLIGRRRQRGWARWATWIGGGLALGALLYITIGLLTPDGPSSGGGSGPPPN